MDNLATFVTKAPLASVQKLNTVLTKKLAARIIVGATIAVGTILLSNGIEKVVVDPSNIAN